MAPKRVSENGWRDAFGASRGVLARKADAFGYPFQLTHLGATDMICAEWQVESLRITSDDLRRLVLEAPSARVCSHILHTYNMQIINLS